MEELLNYLLPAIVPDPHQVKITVTQEEDQVIINLQAPPEQMGYLIGKHGRMVSALRQLAKLKSHLENKQILLQVNELA